MSPLWKKVIILGSLFVSLLVYSLSFTGMYIHDEFGTRHFFIKHKPILKWTFYSPIGMSDRDLADLSPEDWREENLFNEFISSRGHSR